MSKMSREKTLEVMNILRFGTFEEIIKTEEVVNEALDVAIEALNRPHGEWIDEDYGIGKCWATCSECGESANGEAQDNGFGYDYSFPKFCPYCGADMSANDRQVTGKLDDNTTLLYSMTNGDNFIGKEGEAE